MACVPLNCNSSMIGAFRFLLFSIFTLFFQRNESTNVQSYEEADNAVYIEATGEDR